MDEFAKSCNYNFVKPFKPLGNSDTEKLSSFKRLLEYCVVRILLRKHLFENMAEKTGRKCSNIVDYRRLSDGFMPEIIVAIDEFDGYSELLDYDSNYNVPGTVAHLLSEILSSSRKYGIHFY